MIAKIKKGSGFGGLINYANDIAKKDTIIVTSEGVSLSSNAAITASFKAQSRMRPTLKQFVGHISLSFSPNDTPRLSNEFMSQIAREYLQRMGIVNTQFVVFRHQDQPHGHVHIVYNRVDNDGNSISSDSDFRKSAAITKALTREYGLTFGKGKKDVRRGRLKGKDAIKYRMFDAITEVLKGCNDWDSFHAELSAMDISFNFVKGANGNIRGIVFTDDRHNVSFAGGKLDRSLSYGNIRKLMVLEYDMSRHEPVDGSNPKSDNTQSSYTSENRLPVITEIGENTPGPNDSSSTSGSGIGDAITELVLQPHVVPTTGGGGTSNDLGWGEDDDKDKNYKPRKRR